MNEKDIIILESAKLYIVEVRRGWSLSGLDKLENAVDNAKKALEKQIPKKPINPKKTIQQSYIGYQCPTCKEHFTDMPYNYCKICGQAFDWIQVWEDKSE